MPPICLMFAYFILRGAYVLPGAYVVFTTISPSKHDRVKSYFWAHSALSDWSALGRPDKATTPSIGAPPSATFISSSRAVCQGPVTKLVASSDNRIPAPVGIIVPINWDSCPGVRKVICGRACGGNGSITTTTASIRCFPHRNMRPANRGSDRSISAVCRMAASPVSAVAVGLRTRRQEPAAPPASIDSAELRLPELPESPAAKLRKSESPRRIDTSRYPSLGAV